MKLASPIPERWRRRHPLVMGVTDGVFISAMLAMAWAAGLSMMSGVGWILILWVAMAAARPSTYQALVAIALALMFDALSGAPMGARMLPLAGALLAASYAPGPVVRWDVTHGVFALYALAGHTAVELALAAFGNSGGMFLARAVEALLTCLVMSACALAIAAWRHWTDRTAGAVGHEVPVLVRSLR